MPGLVPGIHVLRPSSCCAEDVDGRDTPGHDGFPPLRQGAPRCPPPSPRSPPPTSPRCPRSRASA
ncbi:hypothetical protein C2U70_05170 [Bradyrhizobium guangdongense]|nr:hypothetical protein C2U70_05170 [Bradyrhizobium guangdongense]